MQTDPPVLPCRIWDTTLCRTLMQPCQPWIEADEIADCCGITAGSDNAEALAAAAESASGILYLLSGSRYPGTCERTVRPNEHAHCWGPYDFIYARQQRLSRVKLAGHVTAIIEVLIDGTPVDPSAYRLDQNRFLTRMADPDGTPRRWPTSQRLDLPATEPGTFEITYEHGLAPPSSGVTAAAALACELYKACPAPGDSPGECKLPAGVKRIVRQGVTVETIAAVATMLRKGATGLVAVDAFLSVYGNTTRPSAFYSPDIQPFAQPVGEPTGS